MVRLALSCACIIVALAGCEKPPPEQPQISTDRDSLGFGLEFGSGAYVGTSVANTLVVTNGGQADLVLSNLTVSGQYFRLNDPAPIGQAIAFEEHAFVQLFFEPGEPGDFTGTLTIESNAENEPTKTIPLSGRGIAP